MQDSIDLGYPAAMGDAAAAAEDEGAEGLEIGEDKVLSLQSLSN